MLANKANYAGIKSAVDIYSICVTNMRNHVSARGRLSSKTKKCDICLGEALVYTSEIYDEQIRVCMICAESARERIKCARSFAAARKRISEVRVDVIDLFAYEWWIHPAAIVIIDRVDRACTFCGKLYNAIRYTHKFNDICPNQNTPTLEYNFCHTCAADIKKRYKIMSAWHTITVCVLNTFVVRDVIKTIITYLSS